MMELKFAYNRIKECKNRMESVSTTSGRKYNYEQILIVMDSCPQVKDYWRVEPNARFYFDRVVQVKEFNEAQKVITKPFESTMPMAEIIAPEVDILDLLTNFDYNPCAYIMYLEDLNMIKVGKSKEVNTRLGRLGSKYGKIQLLKVFPFDNEEDAYLMEVILHKYYKEKYPNSIFIPQDRFEGAGFTTEDLETLEKAAEKIRHEIWF